ncbi:MAG TPA: hypothetical protein VJU87_01320 [Gemmatimonadaceae bacterium]|nr:hypothetical protein [Gemmatimonadaceae bacterium]
MTGPRLAPRLAITSTLEELLAPAAASETSMAAGARSAEDREAVLNWLRGAEPAAAEAEERAAEDAPKSKLAAAVVVAATADVYPSAQASGKAQDTLKQFDGADRIIEKKQVGTDWWYHIGYTDAKQAARDGWARADTLMEVADPATFTFITPGGTGSTSPYQQLRDAVADGKLEPKIARLINFMNLVVLPDPKITLVEFVKSAYYDALVEAKGDPKLAALLVTAAVRAFKPGGGTHPWVQRNMPPTGGFDPATFRDKIWHFFFNAYLRLDGAGATWLDFKGVMYELKTRSDPISSVLTLKPLSRDSTEDITFNRGGSLFGEWVMKNRDAIAKQHAQEIEKSFRDIMASDKDMAALPDSLKDAMVQHAFETDDVKIELAKRSYLDLSDYAGRHVQAVLDALATVPATPSEAIAEAGGPSTSSLVVLQDEAERLRRHATVARLEVELGEIRAVDAALRAAFLPMLSDDQAAAWARTAVQNVATQVKRLAADTTLAPADFDERTENLRLRADALLDLTGVFFVKNYAAANTLPTAVVAGALYMANKFLEVYLLCEDIYGKSGTLGAPSSDPRVREMTSPAIAARLGSDTLLQILLAHLAEWHGNLVGYLDVLARSNDAVRNHWATKLVRALDFSLDVALNLTLPFAQLVTADLANPALFLAAMDAKYPGFRQAAFALVQDLHDLDRTAPETSAVLWETIDAATAGGFKPRAFLDSLAHTSPEEMALIISRMIYVALNSKSPWMLLVPALVRKVLAIPSALGNAFEVLSAAERVEYGLRSMSPARYQRLRVELSDPGVQQLLEKTSRDALTVYQYWDTMMASADYTGGHVAAEQSLRAMRELFQ